jgi:hypothetical protein
MADATAISDPAGCYVLASAWHKKRLTHNSADSLTMHAASSCVLEAADSQRSIWMHHIEGNRPDVRMSAIDINW